MPVRYAYYRKLRAGKLLNILKRLSCRGVLSKKIDGAYFVFTYTLF